MPFIENLLGQNGRKDSHNNWTNFWGADQVDSAEAKIAEADELSVGTATFVNLDNDDNDGKFDDTDDNVTGGDDELVHLQLRIPKELNTGTIKLTATAGGGDIKVWQQKTKAAASAFNLATSLNVPADLTLSGDYYVKDFWVEGINAQTSAQATKLKAEHTIRQATAKDEGAVTVIGVDSVEWGGYDNAIDDSSILDADPNWPAGLAPGAKRVFPDARVFESGGNWVQDPNPRSIVHTKTTLSVAPPIPVKVHLRAFDVDDPSADNNAVDNESGPDDNRGTVFGWQQSGVTPGSNVTRELAFAAGESEKQTDYIVSMQPGDNFRLVASADNDFLLRLNNNDNQLNGGGATASADKMRIVNQDIPRATNPPVDREVRQADHYTSDVLTVWRFLHIEVDSMARPTNNKVTTTISSIVPNATGTLASRIFTAANPIQAAVDVTGNGHWHTDSSPNLSSPIPSPGRFENGNVTIGTGNLSTYTSELDGNGNNFVQKGAGISVRFLATDNDFFGNDTFSGAVTALTGTVFTVHITLQSSTPIDWPDFVGGTLNVAGTEMEITAVNAAANTITVDTLGAIPIEVHDDDLDSVLPGTVNVADLQASDNIANNRLAQAYIRPVYDGGGNPGNNQNNVPAVMNTEYSDVYRWQSRSWNSAHYWVAYMLAGFQDSYQAMQNDFDAGAKLGTWASANNSDYATGIGGGGIIFYLESMRDGGLTAAQIARVTVHETGHLFGLADHYPPPRGTWTAADAGIMYGYMNPTANPAQYYYFNPEDLDTIRSTAQTLS